MEQLDRVLEWLDAMGVEGPNSPQFPEEKKFDLFLKLMLEELTECAVSGPTYSIFKYAKLLRETAKKLESITANAETANCVSFTEYRDAIADMTYILGNGIKFAGLDKGEPALYKVDFDEVTKSNFSKLCTTVDEAAKSKEIYAEEGVDTTIVYRNGHYVILRSLDHKVLKNRVSYVQPSLIEV